MRACPAVGEAVGQAFSAGLSDCLDMQHWQKRQIAKVFFRKYITLINLKILVY